MKKGSEYPDATRKKLVGEFLRNADKFLKSGEYDQALSEVEKGLELEPGNFYAQAYRDRITALREKHSRPGVTRSSPPPAAQAARTGLASAPPPPATHEGSELTEITGARVEEVPAGESELPDNREITELRDQIARDRATHETETQRQAEQFARNALEEELRQREEREQLKAAEQQAVAEAVAGVRAEAISDIVARAKEEFGKLISGGDAESAFRQIARIMIIDPDNPGLEALAEQLEAVTLASVKAAAGETKPVQRETALQSFGKLLRSAWGEGTPNDTQAEALAAARTRFAITAEEEKTLLTGIQKGIITEAMKDAYRGGDPDPETRAFLETLTRELSPGKADAGRGPATK